DRILKNGAVVFGEEIEQVFKVKTPRVEKFDIIDGKNGYLTPGLIDVHIHGAGGRDTMDADFDALDAISGSIIRGGVTSFLPTTMTMPMKSIRRALENIADCRRQQLTGAQILGANIEGPFLSQEKKGAQSPEHMLPPDSRYFHGFEDIIKLVTVAPEQPGAEKFIREMSSLGIVTAVGHSAATYEQVNQARSWGLSHATHLFNGMTGIHHRRPGVAGAVLNSNMTCELIADFIHLSPVVLELVMKIKDSDEIILITDSIRAAGLPDGEYGLGGKTVVVRGKEARLKSGSLAGSVLTLDRAVKNMYNTGELPLQEVVKMATINPARLLKVDHKLGRIDPGYRADLTLFDRDLNVKKVFVGGKEKYSSGK
ncbi:MAG: N-acetylglucosamine-6-phosphate deacetylase, partial [Halanaerobiales bacterium]